MISQAVSADSSGPAGEVLRSDTGCGHLFAGRIRKTIACASRLNQVMAWNTTKDSEMTFSARATVTAQVEETADTD